MSTNTSNQPMSAVTLTPLNAISTHLDTLITSLAHSTTYASAPSAATSLIAADDALTTALTALQHHQQNYARILHLREEATHLEDEIRSIIRRAVQLREEAGRVHPSILDDDYDSSDCSDEDAGDTSDIFGKPQEVDYHTLLNFAARIGKHNSVAMREAEAQWDKRKIEAMKKEQEREKENATTATDAAEIARALAQASAPPPPIVAQPTAANEGRTEKDVLELQALDMEASLAARRAQQGLGYPDGNLLRMGELGRLQRIREDAMDGARERGDNIVSETAVEREIEKLVRETEEVAPPEKEETETVEMEDDGTTEEAAGKPGQSVPPRQRRQSTTQRPLPQPQKRKKLNLDLGGDDDDDDDD